MHLRNRNKIKVPTRYEGLDISPISRREADVDLDDVLKRESNGESNESPEVVDKTYEARKKTSTPRKPAYRGPVSEFNHNLPPAAFPTLDHPSQTNISGANVPFRKVKESATPANAQSPISSIVSNSLRSDPNIMSTTALPQDGRDSRGTFHNPAKIPMNRITHCNPNVTPSDKEPRNTILESNMNRMEQLGRMTDVDWLMKEMETSDEDEPSQLGDVASPAWGGFSIALKLHIADCINEHFPGLEGVAQRLKLSVTETGVLVQLLIERQERTAREAENIKLLQSEVHKTLITGSARLSQADYRQTLDETIYRSIGEEDHLQITSSEFSKAKKFLKSRGFDLKMLDDAGISVSSVVTIDRVRPQGTKPKSTTKLSNLPHLETGVSSDEDSAQSSKRSVSNHQKIEITRRNSETKWYKNGHPPQRGPTPPSNHNVLSSNDIKMMQTATDFTTRTCSLYAQRGMGTFYDPTLSPSAAPDSLMSTKSLQPLSRDPMGPPLEPPSSVMVPKAPPSQLYSTAQTGFHAQSKAGPEPGPDPKPRQSDQVQKHPRKHQESESTGSDEKGLVQKKVRIEGCTWQDRAAG